MGNTGIKGQALSHTQRMETLENKTNGSNFTNEGTIQAEGKRLLLTTADAEEYYAYKKQKKIAEIMDALSHSEGVIEGAEDVQRALERAKRIHQAALRITPTHFARTKAALSRGQVAVDCCIGGNGETLPKVKAYEMKLARRMGAAELTVALTPSLVDGCRYAEIRKELKILKRAAKKSIWKVWVDKPYPYTTLMRLARLASEVDARYFSVPYFAGCEQLRYELYRGCRLEILGVETLAEFKKMMGAGVGRIVTSRGYEFFTQWMKEADKIRYVPPKTETVKEPEKDEKSVEKSTVEMQKEEEKAEVPEKMENNVEAKNPETDYHCRLEGTELKFL